MYAIMVTGGKQYKVSVGDVLFVEKLSAEAGDDVTFDKVLAVGGENGVTVGTPTVEGATVTGKVVKNGKSKKIFVFKMKAKKNYRKKQGHRQPYTKVEITGINACAWCMEGSIDCDFGGESKWHIKKVWAPQKTAEIPPVSAWAQKEPTDSLSRPETFL